MTSNFHIELNTQNLTLLCTNNDLHTFLSEKDAVSLTSNLKHGQKHLNQLQNWRHFSGGKLVGMTSSGGLRLHEVGKRWLKVDSERNDCTDNQQQQ